MLLRVIQSNNVYICYDSATDIKMLPALLAIEPEKVFALPDHSLADDDFKLMATLSDLADRELVATIGWAKQVPGKPVLLHCSNFQELSFVMYCLTGSVCTKRYCIAKCDAN